MGIPPCDDFPYIYDTYIFAVCQRRLEKWQGYLQRIS